MDKFGREIFGYKKQEVNEIVKETIKKTEELIGRIKKQEEQISALQAQIIQYQKQESEYRNFLEKTAGNPEKIKKDALMEAEKIEKEARNNADRIISDAIERSERLETKSIKMKQSIKKCRNQLRTIIEQQIDTVEQIEDIELED